MDDVRLKELEKREALLRDTFEDVLLGLERDSEVSVENLKLIRSLAVIWMGAKQLVECEKKIHPTIAAASGSLRLKE